MSIRTSIDIEPLDRQSPVPLHYQISQQIRGWIDSGMLGPGDQIPTEHELQHALDVSRATVRRAISDLVYDGLLHRKRAKGTLVARPKIEGQVQGFGSFTNEIIKRGLTPESVLLDFEIVPAVPLVADKLEIEQGENVVAMERLRTVDGQPVAVERWYAPERYLPGIDRASFKRTGAEQSTYYMLAHRYSIHLQRGVDTVEAVGLEARDAHLLHSSRGYPALLRTRVSYTAADKAIVYVSGVYIIKLIVSLESGKLNVVSS